MSCHTLPRSLLSPCAPTDTAVNEKSEEREGAQRGPSLSGVLRVCTGCVRDSSPSHPIGTPGAKRGTRVVPSVRWDAMGSRTQSCRLLSRGSHVRFVQGASNIRSAIRGTMRTRSSRCGGVYRMRVPMESRPRILRPVVGCRDSGLGCSPTALRERALRPAAQHVAPSRCESSSDRTPRRCQGPDDLRFMPWDPASTMLVIPLCPVLCHT